MASRVAKVDSKLLDAVGEVEEEVEDEHLHDVEALHQAVRQEVQQVVQ